MIGELLQHHLQQALPARMSADDFYIILAGLAALVCVVTIGMSFGTRDNTAARIRAIQERRKEMQTAILAPKKRAKPETTVNFMRMVVMKLQLLKKSQVGKSEALLNEAGFRSKDAIYVLAFFDGVLPVALGIVGFIVMKLNSGHVSPRWHTLNYAWPILGMYLGLKIPALYVRYIKKKRYLQIQRSLSDVLDLMTICAEAGLSLAAMLDRVSRELMIAYPEMAEELGLTAIEIGFLPDRNKALYNLAERCSLPEVRGIVSVLIQTEKYGTPITQALRVLSAEFRQTRMLRAEHKAAKLPAMMTVPMIVFILPTLFIVIIAPAVIGILNTVNH